MKLIVARRKRDLECELPAADHPLDPGWSQVTQKPQPGQSGLPLPGSVQHPLWIQPRSRHLM